MAAPAIILRRIHTCLYGLSHGSSRRMHVRRRTSYLLGRTGRASDAVHGALNIGNPCAFALIAANLSSRWTTPLFSTV